MTVDNVLFEVAPQRHPSLYNPSGDIILSTETNGGVSLFRVHKATLSYHSPVFKDMFALPADPNTKEMYDGVAVVRMTDKYEDLASFLEVLYGQEHTHIKRYTSYSALAVMGALKLADKYQTDYLRDRLVDRIEADWPKSPMEWIAIYRIRQAYAELNKFHGELPKNEPLENQFPEPVSAIQLARNCNIPSILPAAFLALVEIDISNDWDDLRANSDNLHFTLQSARWSLLDGPDRDRLEHGKAVLLAQCEDLHETVFDIPADICRGDILDCQAELRFRRGIPESGTQDDMNSRFTLHGESSVIGSSSRRQPLTNPNPMLILQEIDEAIRDYNLCAPCRHRVRQRIAQKMQECWAELLSVFDLSASPICRA